MRFLTLTPDGKVYNGLIGLNRRRFIDLEKFAVCDNTPYSDSLFLENKDISHFTWKPIESLNPTSKSNFILNVSYKDGDEYKEEFYGAISYMNTLPLINGRSKKEVFTETTEELPTEIVIDTKHMIDTGNSQIYLININNKTFYIGINGWKPIITIKEA